MNRNYSTPPELGFDCARPRIACEAIIIQSLQDCCFSQKYLSMLDYLEGMMAKKSRAIKCRWIFEKVTQRLYAIVLLCCQSVDGWKDPHPKRK